MTDQISELKTKWSFAHRLGSQEPMEFLAKRYKDYIRLESRFHYIPFCLNSYRAKWWEDSFGILWLMNGMCPLGEHIKLMQDKNRLYSNEQLLFGGGGGLALRSLDKICRIKTMRRDKVECESEPLIDSMMDLMNYSILGNLLVRGELE